MLALAFSPAATCLASCGRDSVIKVWDCTTLTGEARERRRDDSGITCGLINNLEGHRGDVVSIEWSETGATLVSGARDNTIKIWALTSIVAPAGAGAPVAGVAAAAAAASAAAPSSPAVRRGCGDAA